MSRVLKNGIAFLILLMCFPAFAQSFETKAKQAFLMDAASGAVLFQLNADEPIAPASLAKLMTL